MLVQVVLLITSAVQSSAYVSNTALYAAECRRTCGTYETCFVYENAEYCAEFCGVGRCNDANETCVVQGKQCDRAPCLPTVVCEPKNQPFNPPVDTSNPCDRNCPMVDAPVCGSNGVSYVNVCYFEEAQCLTPNISIIAQRVCDGDVAFLQQYNPPTGSSTSNSNGNQGSSCNDIMCAPINDPVCTSHGTMQNFCYWQKAKCMDPTITLVNRAVSCEFDASLPVSTCPSTCPTQAYTTPVCGSNGLLYGNQCLFQQAQCTRAAFGGLQSLDLSYCYQRVGDSDGMASDVLSELLSTLTINI